jgi:uncharacterized protein (DUF1499 family)
MISMGIQNTISVLAPVSVRVGLTLLATVLLAGCSSTPGKPGNPQELPECGWLPNCINTQSGRGVQAGEPVAADAGQWQQLRVWIAQQEDWTITIDDDNFMQAVVTTPLLEFRDDVQLLYVPDDRLVHVRSSSQVGLSDLGTNARRVETLREQVRP